MRKTIWYSRFAMTAAHFCGRPLVFALAVALIAIWGITGPIFSFSDTWQLVINTGTTIVTFLMVFLIQNTQNRDTEAMQIKLDEIIRATQGAHNALLDLEELDEATLDAFKAKYELLASRARSEENWPATAAFPVQPGQGQEGEEGAKGQGSFGRKKGP